MTSAESLTLPGVLRAGSKSTLRVWGRATAPARPRPDFLIIGTKRGGTTSLWNWLLQHPLVLPMWPGIQNLKSSHYFYKHYDRGDNWYRSFFPLQTTRVARSVAHKGTAVSGEASPYYLFDPRVPQRVAETLPDAKIIVLLRDPVERAYSHYRERVHEGVEELSFTDAVQAETGRLRGELERMLSEPLYYSEPHDWYSYRSRGVYEPQIRSWRQMVPSENLLVIRSEDLYEHPRGTLSSILGFLGLPDLQLKDFPRHNYHPANGMSPQIREELTAFYAPENQKLYELINRDMGWA